MTDKELLYIEDALEHEQYFQTKFSETASQIKDGELKNSVEDIKNKHQQIYQSLFALLQ
ncbi:MAG: hypothetical protein ACI4IE_06865 [Eubacterium sp.]